MSSPPAATGSTRTFVELLGEQIVSEFSAHQQYVALAVWFDSNDLKQLAKHFYAQALEERNHGMMFVQFMLDRDLPVRIPGVEPVRNEFDGVRELIVLALEQERAVTRQIEALFAAARREGDFIGEQFILWFLKEQVEEVASMSTLLAIVDRAGDDMFKVEDWLARESVAEAGDPSAPAVAGGAA